MNGPLNIHPKVAAGALSASLGFLAVWILGLCHVAVPNSVGAAVVAVLCPLGAWLAPLADAEKTKLLDLTVEPVVPPTK